jgi:hypothetical protein
MREGHLDSLLEEEEHTKGGRWLVPQTLWAGRFEVVMDTYNDLLVRACAHTPIVACCTVG